MDFDRLEPLPLKSSLFNDCLSKITTMQGGPHTFDVIPLQCLGTQNLRFEAPPPSRTVYPATPTKSRRKTPENMSIQMLLSMLMLMLMLMKMSMKMSMEMLMKMSMKMLGKTLMKHHIQRRLLY